MVAGCKTDYQHLPTFSEQKQLQVVILTPAGSNHPQAYDAQKKTFVNMQDAGLPASIKFLPAPANLGFIPSTALKNAETAESYPLQALVLAESVATGTVVEVIPIGTLTLQIADETNYVIVTIPAKPSEQVVAAATLAELKTKYPAAKEIIQQWFLHHNPNQKARLGGWHDEKYTEDLIRRWLE
ncbi:hypothetical protein AAE02nite_40850 [Adhaeribacter aerolatus]|uniref:inorganic diphosphatase n=1 Tax=Adhaeribacter aerolatus TaxID=670289 RepID=A0A512B3A2_9BACT|nr:hypothetical protein AAE02nite_40850 [Adhaeribacter aerolatus]